MQERVAEEGFPVGSAVGDERGAHKPAILVNAKRLAIMKPTAYLINTGRGGLLDEHAVASALKNGAIAGAALDVLSTEPPAADNPLLTAPNCIITPHIAWATQAARKRLLTVAAENLIAFVSKNPVNVVS